MEIINELESIDWDFKRYRQRGIDNIHWFPANFIPQIPSILIANLSKPNSVILDPFCGCGTTLVVSARLGRVGIGVDINPLACLITKVKITYIKPARLEQLLDKLECLLANKNKMRTIIPDFPNKDRWFHRDTLEELGNIFYLIGKEEEKEIQDLLLLCLSAILKKCCSQRDHYTYVADNMFPKEHESLFYVGAKNLFLAQLRKTVHALTTFYNNIEIQGFSPAEILSKSKIYEEDARSLTSIEDDMIDLIVTSPPYANVTDSLTGNRLSFYWLNLGDLKKLKEEEIGARWKRFRKTALDDYIMDMYRSFVQIKRVLKKGAYLCCVLGETSSIRKKFDLNRKLIDVLTNELGLKILSQRIERNIYAKRIRAVRGVTKEHIYVLQKNE